MFTIYFWPIVFGILKIISTFWNGFRFYSCGGVVRW